MPRKSKGPYLYLDPKRKQWIIRDGSQFSRTGIEQDLCEQAEAALTSYVRREAANIDGLIYFLTAAYPNFPVKIGFTRSIAALRLPSLQCACPYALYFIGHYSGSMAEEKRNHARFDRLRMRGEWFKRDYELLSHINAACSNVVELVA